MAWDQTLPFRPSDRRQQPQSGGFQGGAREVPCSATTEPGRTDAGRVTSSRWLPAAFLSLLLAACGGDDGAAEDACDQGEAVSNECDDQGEGRDE